MILKIIMQAVCAFLYFCCGVAVHEYYVWYKEAKKALTEPADNVIDLRTKYTIFYIEKARSNDYSLVSFYDGFIVNNSLADEQIRKSIWLLADKRRKFCHGYAAVTKDRKGNCFYIIDLNLRTVTSFYWPIKEEEYEK